ncbi:unnamed protein product [Rotaria sp. Silwood1]|nr:unnamed protein product [Rotaria sp. Silwood1]
MPRLAQIYTTFEYEQNDISSLYSACRIIDTFSEDRSYLNELCKNENSTRSKIREELFRFLFDLLWTKLLKLCSSRDENQIQQWSYMYTFIYKYYPSGTLLRSTKLADIGDQIEFMRLAYSIFLNENIPNPIRLVSQLLEHQPNENSEGISSNKSSYLKILPDIINIIHEYFANRNANEHVGDGILLIDFQQWIISILKTSKQRTQDDINSVFVCLGDSGCQWSMPAKQLLFDELIDLTSIQFQPNISSIVDRIEYLLPIVMQCVSDRTRLQDYQIPYHPSILQQHQDNRLVLLDLFFFHIDRHANESVINKKLINELIALKPPKIKDQDLMSSAKTIYKQLKEYFLLRSAALYLCQTALYDTNDSNEFFECVKVLINDYLSIKETAAQLTPNLQIFLSTIISKRSWTFLLDLLKSDQMQNLNRTWASILYRHLELKQVPKPNKYLKFSHQLQFTLSPNSHALSIFPHLHQLYDELTQIIITCINNKTGDQWKPLSDWIQLKLNTVPVDLQMNNIKAMLLLNIYYNYYCNNQLQLLNTLLNTIERTLDPSSEELSVFRNLLEPERYMIGYPQQNNNTDFNYLNNLFRLDCEAADELCIRHSLVNLMAMIIKGGAKSFLWTFAFEPLSIEGTFGKYLPPTATTLVSRDQ